MVDYLYAVIISFVVFEYRVVHHAQRQRRPVVRLIVEVRRDLVIAENRSDNVLLRERRYLFRGLRNNRNDSYMCTRIRVSKNELTTCSKKSSK